jgi:hypothetical protein
MSRVSGAKAKVRSPAPPAGTDQDMLNRPERTKPPAAQHVRFQRRHHEVIEPFFQPGGFHEKVFNNPSVCDWDGLKGRVLSNRIALEADDPLMHLCLPLFLSFTANALGD